MYRKLSSGSFSFDPAAKTSSSHVEGADFRAKLFKTIWRQEQPAVLQILLKAKRQKYLLHLVIADFPWHGGGKQLPSLIEAALH